MRRFLLGLLLAAGLLAAPASAGAMSISSSVTLSGVVPEMRFVYINQAGFIISVVGNTSNNITPRVVGVNNKEQPLTDAISRQYDYFMSQHKWQLEAGVTYLVNPVQVNTSVNPQNIEINTGAQTVAGDLQLQVGITPESGQSG